MGNRIARIQNDTPWSITMKEHRLMGKTWRYSHSIRVDPNNITEITASLFLTRNHLSGFPSEIVIFANGAEFKTSLVSQDFIKYVKIILCVEGRYFVVKGVLPQLLDLSWFWGCGFLGREYRGRECVTIMRCRISTLLL